MQRNRPQEAAQVQLPDGRRMGYAQYGTPNGRPVLYCHGGLSCSVDIAFAQQRASEMGIRLIAPDRSGVGLSDRNRGRTLTSVADDIGHLLNVLEIPAAPVLGWSLGAPYALACGYQLGERITSIATVGGIGPLDRQGAVPGAGHARRSNFACLASANSVDSWARSRPLHMPPAQICEALS